jgi:peptidoglycan/LPS O-acetylase OafA/YrhL
VAFLFVLCKRPWSKTLVLLYSFCLLELIWRMVLIDGMHAPWDRTYYASDTRMDSIVYGCALAFIMNARVGKDWLEKDHVRRALITAGLVGILISLLWRGEDFRNIWRYSVQGLSLTPLFYYSITKPTSGAFPLLNTRIMKKIGVYSYSIYLTHLIIISNLQLSIHQTVVIAAITAPISLLLAWIIDRFIDQPLQKVRHRYR